MIGLFLMMAVSLVFGRIAEVKKNKICAGIGNLEDKLVYKVSIISIAVSLILFSGLRTAYNDTRTYIRAFNMGVTKDISFNIISFFRKPYYGFDYWQRLIKHFLGSSQWLLMTNAIVTISSYIMFYIKNSKTLSLTLLSYIIIGTYTLSMAAQKQVLAMAISLLAIECLMKKRYKLCYLLIIIAYTFHPYIVVLCIMPLLVDDVWSRRMIKIVLLVTLGAVSFSQIIGLILGAADAVGVGKSYDVAEMTSHTINPLRVIIDGLPILISWILRDEINTKGDKFIKFGINMMLVSWLMTFASLFANPIYVYRTGQYFSSLNPIVIPWMLVYCLPETKYKRIIIIGYMLLYAAFCTQQIIQFGGYSIFYDPFKHTSIKTLFK